MQFSEDDKKRLFGFYDSAIERFGAADARALRWTEESQQRKRFELLAAAGDLSGASILDVGAGFGDLYGFLRERFANIRYLGLDINPGMIDVARAKYPEASFEVADFGEWKGSSHDYCLASGAFSFKVADYRHVYLGYIKKMFEHSRVAAVFNLLDARHHIDDDTFAAYMPQEMYAYCRGLTEKVFLNDQYLRQDFTLYLYI